MFKNALQVLSFVGAIAFAGGVVLTAIRRDSRTAAIPWWWWLGNGGSLLLLGLGNDFGWFQSALYVAGAFSLGIGAALLVIGLRAGSISLRRRSTPSPYDLTGDMDWRSGASLIHVLGVNPYMRLEDANPYIDLRIELINLNLHAVQLANDVRGRLMIPDNSNTLAEVLHPPELQQIDRLNDSLVMSQQLTGQGIVMIQRNERVGLTIRQYLLPDVRDELVRRAGESVQFTFTKVDVGVIFVGTDSVGKPITKPRQRMPLDSYQLTVPERYGRS